MKSALALLLKNSGMMNPQKHLSEQEMQEVSKIIEALSANPIEDYPFHFQAHGGAGLYWVDDQDVQHYVMAHHGVAEYSTEIGKLYFDNGLEGYLRMILHEETAKEIQSGIDYAKIQHLQYTKP